MIFFQSVNDKELLKLCRLEHWILPDDGPAFKFGIHMRALSGKLHKLISHSVRHVRGVPGMDQVRVDGIICSINRSKLERWFFGMPLELSLKSMMKMKSRYVEKYAASSNPYFFNIKNKMIILNNKTHPPKRVRIKIACFNRTDKCSPILIVID